MNEKPKSILVTGGAGFIGSHLVDRLVEQGHRVTVLDDLSSGFRDNVHPRANLVLGDVRDLALLTKLVNEADACFHLAAIASVQQCSQSWLDSHSINLSAFVGLLEIVAKRLNGVIPVVYVSSAAVYGNTTIYPVHEELTLRPISTYGADKAASEMHAHAAGHNGAVPTFGLRPFNVYGPRQNASSPYSGVISIFVDKLRRGESLTIYGDGHQTRDFIHVSDIVSILIAAMGNASVDAPVCNAATGRETSIIDVAHKLAEILNCEAKIALAPARSGDIYRSVADVDQMRALLGYEARIGIAEGLRFVLDK